MFLRSFSSDLFWFIFSFTFLILFCYSLVCLLFYICILYIRDDELSRVAFEVIVQMSAQSIGKKASNPFDTVAPGSKRNRTQPEIFAFAAKVARGSSAAAVPPRGSVGAADSELQSSEALPSGPPPFSSPLPSSSLLFSRLNRPPASAPIFGKSRGLNPERGSLRFPPSPSLPDDSKLAALSAQMEELMRENSNLKSALLQSEELQRTKAGSDARTALRRSAFERLLQENHDLYSPEEVQNVKLAMGATGSKVRFPPQHPSLIPPPSAKFQTLLYQSSENYLESDGLAGQSALQTQYAVQVQREYLKKDLDKCLQSEYNMYDFLSKRSVFSPTDPEASSFSTLLHFFMVIKGMSEDQSEAWKISRAFVDRVFKEVALSRQTIEPKNLSDLLGPPPADGNYRRALDACPLFTSTLNALTVKKLTTKQSSAEDKFKRKQKDSKSNDAFSGSAKRTDKYKLYCKHHNSWFESHDSDGCRFKDSKNIKRRPGDNAPKSSSP